MSRNVEIKASCPDLNPVRGGAARLASSPGQIVDQRDTFFVVPTGRLKVREFADGSGELIAYERSDQKEPKTSEYTRIECREAAALIHALKRVLALRGVVVKRREVFLVGRTRIHLDQVEDLGSFVELEVVLSEGGSFENGVREADELLQALGLPRSALIAGAYIDLLEARSTGAARSSGNAPSVVE